MIPQRLIFLKDAFPGFELQFIADDSCALIINPNYDANIIVYDDEFEFTVCFLFQHCHFTDEDDVIDWICNIISGNTFAIEFFNNEQCRFGGEIAAEQLQDLSYEKLEQFTGYYGLTKLLDVADSFKIRGWDNKNNFDYKLIREANGGIEINQTFVTGL